jgi:hypothetical protein
MLPGMLVVWGFLLLLFLALKVYAMRLSRDEDDQLVLDDSFEHVRAEQAAIVARLNKVQPLMRIVLLLLCLMTLAVIGYYVVDAIRQFQ